MNVNLQSSPVNKYPSLVLLTLFFVSLSSVLVGTSTALFSPLVPLAVLCLLSYIIVAFVRPETVAFLLVLVLPVDLYISSSGFPGFFLSQVLIAVGFVVVLVSKLAKRERLELPLGVQLLWLLPLAGIVSLLVSGRLAFQDLSEVLKIASFPMAASIVALTRSSPQFVRKLFGCIVAANVIVVTYGFFLQITNYAADPLGDVLGIRRTVSSLIGQPETLRMSSTFRYSTELAAYLLMIALLYTGILFSRKAWIGSRFSYYCLLALLIANLALLVLSYTRGAWLAFVVMILISESSRAGKRRSVRIILLLMLVVSIGYVLFSAVPGFQARILEIFESGSLASYEGRILVWRAAIDAFQRDPWTGVGLGLFLTVPVDIAPNLANISNGENLYLTYAVEMGMLGLTALFLPLVAMSRNLLVNLKFAANQASFESIFLRGVALAIMGMLLYAFFDPVLTSSQNGAMFWMLMSLQLQLDQGMGAEQGLFLTEWTSETG